MNLANDLWYRGAKSIGVCLISFALAGLAFAQGIGTTTVQGTVYLANGRPGSGTVQVTWPAFTTASNQTVTAGRTTATIGSDGFLSVNLAPNLGSSPSGLYYTAVFHLSDGTTSTEYWVVPSAEQVSIAQVRAQVMPAAQATQAVSKAYVDQAVQSLAQGNLTSTGNTLTGPLYLNGDPTQALQAADKRYVDSKFAQAVPITGAALTGPLTSVKLGAAFQVDQFAGADFGAKLQACLETVDTTYGGTCDARNFSGALSMASDLMISKANVTILLPCATVSTAKQVIVSPGTRNVALRGCALRGASGASGSQGGTVFLYSGTSALLQVGDRTYLTDTPGFHLDNAVINTTASNSATTQAVAAYRTQEMDLQSLYFLGNANQTGMTLDGTGNYTGGTFYDNAFTGFQTAVNAIGHQASNSATTDWLNASTFVRLHINCPTSSGSPIGGTYGINLMQGDGNTFTGGDVEGCGTAFHLGANAQNNTIVGLRNENSTYQVVADSGSSYNNWMTGGTMFTGKLTDNGTRNSFLDTFHRSFNGITGDWYGSQQDATLTNHYRVGIGAGNERGLLNRYQTDSGYRWTTGLSDATGGEQFYQVLDELNNVYRLSIGQYNSDQPSTNNQTVVNAGGTGAVVLNGSNNSGTGGVVFGSGGPSETTVATINNAGNAQFNGTLQVGGTSQSVGTMTVRNNADAEVDYYLWPGLTKSQKGSFVYKDWNGNSQWYMVKDASNNWALNSATGGLDSIKAYQSTNSGDTHINASNSTGVVRVNYETGAGSAFNVYGGNSGTLYASLSGPTSIKFPGLSAGSGRNCLQIDASGYMSNTGSACSSASGNVGSGTSGQIAYYSGNGTTLGGISAIPVSAGGTGASSAGAALTALGGASLVSASVQSFAGPVNAPSLNASVNSQINVMAPPFNAKGDCVSDDHDAITAAQAAALLVHGGAVLYFPKPPGGCYLTSKFEWSGVSMEGQPGGTESSNVTIKGKPGQDVLHVADPTTSSAQWLKSWSIEHISFTVDNSVAGSFPHRWPGRWFDDASMTAGSAVFKSNGGNITCADIGQAIKVGGAGVAGADLVTTIQSVSPCWSSSGSTWTTVTLADAASTTVSSAHTYVSLLNLPVTTNIGNCAIAWDDLDGNPAHLNTPNTHNYGNIYNVMRNVSFGVTSGQTNNVCGIYTQGLWGFYGLDARNFEFRGQVFGVVQGSSELGAWYQSSSNDFQKWDHGSMEQIAYPYIAYNGGYNAWEDIELTAKNGFQLIALANYWADGLSNSTINISEYEDGSGPFGMRIEGQNQHMQNLVLTAGSSQSAYVYTRGSTCDNCILSAKLNVGGGGNHFKFNSNQIPATAVTDGGLGNTFINSYNSNPLNGIYPNYSYNITPKKGRHNETNRITSDFIRDGNYSTPYTLDDLFLWPNDTIINNQGVPGVWEDNVQSDSTSPTGYNFIVRTGHAISNFAQAFNYDPAAFLPVGKAFPAAPATIVFLAKCDAGTTTFNMTVGAMNGGYGYNAFYGQAFTCTTSYQTYSMVVDFTPYPGGDFFFTSGLNTFYAAWVGIRPYVADVNGIKTSTLQPQLTTTLSAKSWAWAGTNYGIADATSPVGFSTAISNAWSLTSANGSTNLNGGYLYPAVSSEATVVASAPTVFTNTLNGALAAGDTSMTLTTPSTSIYANGGCFQVDQEILCYSGTPSVGTTVYTITRGQGGTLAQPHANGATLSSIGTAGMYIKCNGVNQSFINVYFTPTWTAYSAPFPGQNCSGYPTTTPWAFLNGPTGQVYKVALIQFRQAPNMNSPTAANQVPVSVGSAPYTWGATKALAGSGAGVTTGPLAGTTVDHIVTYTGGNGQTKDSGITIQAVAPLVGTTPNIGGSALTTGQCASGTVGVANSTTTMAVVVSPTTYPGDGMAWRGYVSTAGVVTVKVCAEIAGTPTASPYNVRVIP